MKRILDLDWKELQSLRSKWWDAHCRDVMRWVQQVVQSPVADELREYLRLEGVEIETPDAEAHFLKVSYRGKIVCHAGHHILAPGTEWLNALKTAFERDVDRIQKEQAAEQEKERLSLAQALSVLQEYTEP